MGRRNLWRSPFVAPHAVAAVAAPAAGAATLWRVALFDVCLWSPVGMEVFV